MHGFYEGVNYLSKEMLLAKVLVGKISHFCPVIFVNYAGGTIEFGTLSWNTTQH